MAPVATVYITNHNYGRYLEQAIQSVLGQTYRDFELIIIDDGSTDNSSQTINKYAEHPGITTIYQHRRGLNVTNNIALRAARGRYIMRLDADDYLDPNALMVLVNALEQSPEAGLVFPDYYVVDDAGNVLDVVRRHDFSKVTLLDQPAHGACTLIRRDCLTSLGGYDEAFDRQDGYDLWLRLIGQFAVRNVNLPLFYYRQHGDNLTANETRLLETRARITEKQVGRIGRKLSAVGIVPVRGPAADPDSPALKMLGDRAIVDWTIDEALAASRLSALILTTPDEQVLKHVAERYDDRVFRVQRARKLAMRNTPVEETLIDALEQYEKEHPEPDVVVVLYTECPFRKAQDIDNAVNSLELFGTDSVVAVRPEIDEFYRHNGGGLESLRGSRQLRLEREELFRAVGQMYVVRKAFLETQRHVVGGKVGHVVLDKQAAFALQSQWDWDLAQLIAGSDATTQFAAKGGRT